MPKQLENRISYTPTVKDKKNINLVLYNKLTKLMLHDY